MDVFLNPFSLSLAGAAAAYAYMPFWLQGQRKRGRFLKVLTECPEGRAQVLTRGGAFDTAVISLKGYHLNVRGRPGYDPSKPEWEVLPNKKRVRYDRRPFPLRAAGLFWVGFLRDVLRYRQRWCEPNQEANAGADAPKFKFRNEETPFFYVNQVPYTFTVDEQKTKDLLPVQMTFTLTVQITNVKQVFSQAEAWLVSVGMLVQELARDYIGTHEYASLQHETEEKGGVRRRPSDLAQTEFKALVAQRREQVKKSWGVDLLDVNINLLKLTGKFADEDEEATKLKYFAERKGDATRITAAADADAIRARGTAQAEVIKATTLAQAEGATKLVDAYAKHPKIGKSLILAEALKSPGDGKVIIMPANDLLGSVFGAAEALKGKDKK